MTVTALPGTNPSERSAASDAPDFGDTRAEFHALLSGCGLYDLSGRARIAVTGGDRVRWLNGMVTNNIRDLAPEHGVYAFMLNAQGRIQADLYAFQRGDSLLLDAERGQRDKILQLFDHYIIADDVEIADVSDKFVALGLAGPESRHVLERAGISFPDLAPLELCTPKCDCACGCLQCTLVRGDDPTGTSYEIWLAPDQLKSAWDGFSRCGRHCCRRRRAGASPNQFRDSALWRGYSRARSSPGNRADTRVEFHQRVLSRAGDRGAHPLARRCASRVHGVHGRGCCCPSRAAKILADEKKSARLPAARFCRCPAEIARSLWAICGARLLRKICALGRRS